MTSVERLARELIYRGGPYYSCRRDGRSTCTFCHMTTRTFDHPTVRHESDCPWLLLVEAASA